MAKKRPSPHSSPRLSHNFTNTQRIQELIELMTDNGLTEIELVEDKSRIILRRGVTTSASSALPASPHSPVSTPHHLQGQSPSHTPAAPAPAEDAGWIPVKSPMVGTFYSAPSPDAAAYVSVGSNVDEKTVVCIIEAMKHFNDIYAETRGSIAKVLVSNGQVVEFGQPLFLVRPH